MSRSKTRRERASQLARLGALTGAAHLTLADVRERDRLRVDVGRYLARAEEQLSRAVTQRALAVRGVGCMPTRGEEKRAVRAHRAIREAEAAMGHPLYPDLGRTRVRELVLETR